MAFFVTADDMMKKSDDGELMLHVLSIVKYHVSLGNWQFDAACMVKRRRPPLPPTSSASSNDIDHYPSIHTVGFTIGLLP
jgi:hypothetical protein